MSPEAPSDVQEAQTEALAHTLLLAQDASFKITTYSSTYAAACRAGHRRKLLQEIKKLRQQMTYLRGEHPTSAHAIAACYRRHFYLVRQLKTCGRVSVSTPIETVGAAKPVGACKHAKETSQRDIAISTSS
ncbi:hypothetical protein B0H13DRAFT_2349141 [Mycena leptocephala]|nr:hypothetical protein B0H13DRAFT_2349141 [Mycena leptocephala]